MSGGRAQNDWQWDNGRNIDLSPLTFIDSNPTTVVSDSALAMKATEQYKLFNSDPEITNIPICQITGDFMW